MKDFSNACKRVIEVIEDEGKGSSIDVLLWIYMNLLCYPLIRNKEEGYKEELLKLMAGSNKFSELLELAKNIPLTVYTLLIEEILKHYTYMKVWDDQKTVALKTLESIYERLLQQKLRSKTGSYYTPEYIVDYITSKSIEAYINNSLGTGLNIDGATGIKEELSRSDAEKIVDIIDNIKIIDIACGGGAFLRSGLRVLYHIKRAALIAMDLQEEGAIKADIAERSIFGMDIQASTVLLCRILMLMALEGDSLDVELNIKEGNSLLLEDLGCYDIVLGNPPYLGERGNKEFFMALRSTDFGSRYYESKMDYFYYFIYRGTELLKENGVLGYITTNYFVTADGAFKLRRHLRESLSFKTIVNFNDVSIFQDAKGQHNMLYIALKGSAETCDGVLLCFESGNLKPQEIEDILNGKSTGSGVNSVYFKNQKTLYDSSGQILIQSEGSHAAILKRIQSGASSTLGGICDIKQGLVSGADRLTAALKEKLELELPAGAGIFVLTRQEAQEKGFFSKEYEDLLKPFYKNSNVYKYGSKDEPQLYILYITDSNVQCIEDYPVLLKHLLPYKAILESRREVVQGSISWYSLQWPRDISIFYQEKILAPQRSLENIFGYSSGPWFASADVYFISLKEQQISLNYLLGFLNSPVIYFWLYYRGKRKGDYLELYSTPLKAIPIPTYCTAEIEKIDRLVSQIRFNIDKGLDYKELENRVNTLIFELYAFNQEEVREIIRLAGKRRRRK